MVEEWNRSETGSLHKVGQQQVIRYTCYAFSCVKEARDLVSGSTVVLSVFRLTFRSVQQSEKCFQQRQFARRAGILQAGMVFTSYKHNAKGMVR